MVKSRFFPIHYFLTFWCLYEFVRWIENFPFILFRNRRVFVLIGMRLRTFWFSCQIPICQCDDKLARNFKKQKYDEQIVHNKKKINFVRLICLDNSVLRTLFAFSCKCNSFCFFFSKTLFQCTLWSNDWEKTSQPILEKYWLKKNNVILMTEPFPFIPFCWKESDWKCFSNVYGLNDFFPCRTRIFLLLVDCSNLSNPNIEFTMCIRRAKELNMTMNSLEFTFTKETSRNWIACHNYIKADYQNRFKWCKQNAIK